MWAGASLGGPSRGAESGKVVYGEFGTKKREQRTVNAMSKDEPRTVQRPITPDEISQRINTYFLAVEPLVKIAVKIERTQSVAYRFGNDGTLERIEQTGWSKEAKELYATVQKEIEYLRDLYLVRQINP